MNARCENLENVDGKDKARSMYTSISEPLCVVYGKADIKLLKRFTRKIITIGLPANGYDWNSGVFGKFQQIIGKMSFYELFSFIARL